MNGKRILEGSRISDESADGVESPSGLAIVSASVVGLVTWPPILLVVWILSAGFLNPNPATGMFGGFLMTALYSVFPVVLTVVTLAVVAAYTLASAGRKSWQKTLDLFGRRLMGTGGAVLGCLVVVWPMPNA